MGTNVFLTKAAQSNIYFFRYMTKAKVKSSLTQSSRSILAA